VAVATLLLLAGCGSGLTAHPAPATTSNAATTPTTQQAEPASTPSGPTRSTSVFHVVLSGTPTHHHRPPSGKATIQILAARGEVCWTFTGVAGIPHPAGAIVGIASTLPSHVGWSPGSPFMALGSHYAPRGCVRAVASAAGQLQSVPADYYVGIASGTHANVLTGLL
jgi:hypothetical protein